MASSLNWFNRARLASGLVLFAFVTTHYLNHILGLVGLDAMEAGRRLFLLIWRNPLGSTILYAAIATHISLALASLYRRRTWRSISRAEVVQILFGAAIPPLVVEHVLANRGLNLAFGLNDNYAYVLLSIWLFEPWLGVQQVIVVLVAWLHGCIGVHMWLRLKPWYPRALAWLYTTAVLLPVLAIAGFADGSREAVRLYADPIWRASYFELLQVPPAEFPAVRAWLDHALAIGYWLMIVAACALVIARVLSGILRRRGVQITISYPMDRKVVIQPGTSVLEASRMGGIPHASVCGGRGRCSTCRVRIGEGSEFLPAPSEEEVRVLARVSAPEGVRLACQIRPTHSLFVTPLLPAVAQAKDGFKRPGYMQGSEREIAILFADLRAFTKFAEQKLPYDVVFVINQYFRSMGQAIEQAGGQLDKFIGDGVMALFGLNNGSEEGCRQALSAARGMAEALNQLNQALAHDLPEPLRIGIGVHAGTVIVGEMGYARVTSVTAIGDAVNTASRLEQLTKEFSAQLVVSRRVAKRAGVDLSRFPRREIEVRGRVQPMIIYVIKSALDLPVDAAVKSAKPQSIAPAS